MPSLRNGTVTNKHIVQYTGTNIALHYTQSQIQSSRRSLDNKSQAILYSEVYQWEYPYPPWVPV